MHLVSFIGKDKESYGQITALLNKFETEKIILVKDKSTTTHPLNEKCQTISVNTESDLISLKKEILEKLKPVLNSEFEVAVSIASGNGKEHMALIGALLTIPVGIKLTAFTKNGIEFLT